MVLKHIYMAFVVSASVFLLTVSGYAQALPVEGKKALQTAEKLPEIKSLLFSDTDIKLIRDARLFYEQYRSGKKVDSGIAEEDFLKSLERIATSNLSAAPTSFTYPQFFLSSIAYNSPDDWVVWVNDKKITKDSGVTGDGLRVIEIDREKVVFEWKPEKMDKVVDVIEYSQDNPVKVNFMKNNVEFSLKANQTFTSYAMRVVEGKVLPVTVSLNDGSIIK